MSKTTADRRLAARIFAVAGGVLLGIGVTLIVAGLGAIHRPMPVIALVLLVGGIVATLVGGVLAFTSVLVRGPHRIGHLFGWVVVPALVAGGALWAWLAWAVMR